MSKKILSAFAAVIIIIAVAVVLKKSEYNFSGFYLDTAVICRTVSSDSRLSDKCRSIVAEISGETSAYDEGSVIYRLNHGEEISLDLQGNIPGILNGYKNFEKMFGKGITSFCGSLTFLWNISSDSPRVPSQAEINEALTHVCNSSEYNGGFPEGASADLGAGAKGYVCDLILEAAESDDSAEEIIFSAGSSSLMFSKKDRQFTAAVDDPFGNENAFEFSCGNSIISTAGGYERFFEDNGKKYTHIMDINTGYPAETDLSSVTVILPCEKGNGLYSDLLSTLIYIGGSENAESYARICQNNFSSFGMIIIDENEDIITFGNAFAEISRKEKNTDK